MSQEMTCVTESFERRGVSVSGDWADIKSREIAANFVAIDGAENWHLPDFDWPSLCGIIARELRKGRRAEA